MATTASCFPGPTKPGIGIRDMAFDADGSLFMSSASGLSVHRRGSKKTESLAGPEGGGEQGLAAARGRILVGASACALLRSTEGPTLQQVEVATSGVALSADGKRFAVGTGYPGGSNQHVVVYADDGTVVSRITDEAVRNVTSAFAFVDGDRALAFCDEGRLMTADVLTGAVSVHAPFQPEFGVPAQRIESFAGGVLAIFAGRGRFSSISAALLDLDGRPIFVDHTPTDAHAVASNPTASLLAIVRGAVIDVRNARGEPLREIARAKATHSIDAAVLSDDGWLALASGSKSGTHAKAVEFVALS